MTRLTQNAILTTFLGAAILYFTDNVALVLTTSMSCVTLYHLRVLGWLSPRASEWWDWIYVLSILASLAIWTAVTARNVRRVKGVRQQAALGGGRAALQGRVTGGK